MYFSLVNKRHVGYSSNNRLCCIPKTDYCGCSQANTIDTIGFVNKEIITRYVTVENVTNECDYILLTGITPMLQLIRSIAADHMDDTKCSLIFANQVRIYKCFFFDFN